ncbi:MAG: Sec-independent protein translocase subunit TatB, partial [Epsilonproteobacteria bacterium]|nr:Sec-independent protein translocase subunit TatB [Campylobacterota bacterium]
MFDMGFTEILFIAIIAIIFIGPENLPSTMAKIAKFFRNFKQSIDKAKREFEEEINISQLKDEALKYKQELEAAREELSAFKQIAQKESQEIRENLA